VKKAVAFLAFALIIDIIILYLSAERVTFILLLISFGASSEPIALFLEFIPLILSLIMLPLLAWKLFTLLRGGGENL